MYRDKKRYGHDPATVVRSKPGTFNAPLHWKERARVFVCSWSDFFIEDADSWRDEAWDIIRRTQHLDYLILTKRPENIMRRLPMDWPIWNVWLGVTAENQEQADKRLPILLSIPATLHFVSVEPMIGDINLRLGFRGTGVDWVICGGESGPDARVMDQGWALDLKKQCAVAGVPFFMKQMSRKAPIPDFLQGREFPRSI